MDTHIDALYLLNVFVAMLLAGALLNSWLDHRHVPGVPAWTIGLCFVAAEALMIGLLSRESELAAVCRSMVAGGYAMFWIGVRQFNGERFTASWTVAPLAALPVLAGPWLLSGATTANVAAVAMTAAFALLAAVEVLRGRQQDRLRGRSLAALAFVAAAVGMIHHAGTLLDVVPGAGPAARLFVDASCVLAVAFGLMSMANERVRRRFEQLASTDVLTGLPNRRFFFERGEGAARYAASNHLPAAVLMMDIDHFSSVNTRFGHHGGDRALVAFAAAVRRELRNEDLFGRYGGEEFCVLLCGADEREGRGVAERLCAAVARLAIDMNGEALRMTVSIGVAPLAGVDLQAAIQRADVALYCAKNGGRNRVCATGDLEDSRVRQDDESIAVGHEAVMPYPVAVAVAA